MNEQEKIHLLTAELIPLIDDVEAETKEVMEAHIKECQSCQIIYKQMNEWEEAIPTQQTRNETEIKPFKKLAQFNRGLKVSLIAIRVVILVFLIGLDILIMEPNNFLYLRGITIMFYAPASIFLLVFTYVFLQRRWFSLSLIADSMIIFILTFLLPTLF